jgi:hypothetical protein
MQTQISKRRLLSSTKLQKSRNFGQRKSGMIVANRPGADYFCNRRDGLKKALLVRKVLLLKRRSAISIIAPHPTIRSRSLLGCSAIRDQVARVTRLYPDTSTIGGRSTMKRYCGKSAPEGSGR